MPEDDRFRKMVEDSQDWFWEFDEFGKFTYSSRRIRNLLGYEPEEIIGLNAFDLMDPAEAERVRRHFDPLAKKYLPFTNLINVNRHKDGHDVVIESSGTPIFDAEGRFRGYRGIDRDITERVHAEDLLRKSASKLADIIETSAEWIWETDLAGRHVYSNHVLGSLLGYSKEEFIGRTYTDFLHPDDLAEVSRRLPQHIAQGRGWQGWVLRWKHKDGSYRWLESNARPVLDADGRVVGFRGADRDMTDRLRISEELRQSREKLNDIVTLLPQAIYEADASGRLIFANRVAFELFGYAPDDLASGLNVLEMIVPGDVERARQNIAELYRGQAGSSHEYTALRKDGSSFPVIIYSNIVRQQNEPVGLRGVIVDITRRKEYERELEKARDAAETNNRAKDEFLANMSHELRTPMTAIIGFSELLEQTELSEQQQSYLKTITSSTEALLALVNDLLDIAEIEAGKVRLEKRDFNLRGLVAEIVETQQPAAQAKEIALRARIAEEVPDRLAGDPLRLKQILLNLVVNALKFTDRGEIILSVAIEEGDGPEVMLRFEVADTGVGISGEDVARIFQPFTQVDASPRRRVGGAGLGLTICARLSAIMGGRIEVQSRTGTGSTFLVRLPFAAAAGQPEDLPAPSASRFPVMGDALLRILLVEDNEVSQQYIVEALQRLGHRLELAGNGEEALALLAEQRYDLVLMDLQMPIMDGMEAIGTIRDREMLSGEHLPVIALTAHAMEKDRARAMSMGFDGYITKPVKVDDLLTEIRRCLSAA